MGTIIVEKFWCDGVDLYKMWLYDEIKGSCDLSTSYHEDFTWFGCKSTWTWFYGTTMIFFGGICADSYESTIRRFLGTLNYLKIGCDLGFFSDVDFIFSEDIAQNDEVWYFYETEK